MAVNLEGIGSLIGGIFWWFILGALGLGLLVGLVVFFVWLYKRKKWFLQVGIKLPRAGGGLILAELAKGRYDVVAGIVDMKRKGVKPVGVKPFDVRKYLQGEKYLEVMQISPTDYIPLDPASYKVVEDEFGNKCVVSNIKTDLLKRKTWKNYMERSAKSRFTLAGFLEAHWRAIEISIIVFIIFIGFLILWMRMPTICQ